MSDAARPGGNGGRKKVEGVLLDVDGTLIDSNNAHAESWSAALEEFGHHVPAGNIRPRIGMGGDKLIPLFLGVEPDSATGKRFSERRAQIFLETYVPKLRPTRGARELVERLRREGLKLVIATSAKPSELEPMLEHVGLDGLIERKTSADDADHSKPDPDIVHAALKKAGLTPDTAVMLGDTPYDVEAALAANVECVALLSGGWNAEALHGAAAIYEDPADLLRSFTSSLFSCAALSPGRPDTTR